MRELNTSYPQEKNLLQGKLSEAEDFVNVNNMIIKIGASTNPRNLDLNRNLNPIRIENSNWKQKLKSWVLAYSSVLT